MRRWIWVVGVLGLLVAQLPAAAVAAEQPMRTGEFVWVFEKKAPNTGEGKDGVTVSRSDISFLREFTGPPAATFLVEFPQARQAVVEPYALHEFEVTVMGAVTVNEEVGGLYRTDAILMREGRWDGQSVGVTQGCNVDFMGNFHGCSAGETQKATFRVRFPDSAANEDVRFRFGVGALNCAQCLVEYIYKPQPIDPNEPRCFGSVATVEPVGTVYTGTSGNDVMIGTNKSERFHGNGGNDKICAGGKTDKIYVGAGYSFVDGGAGRDLLRFKSGPVAISHDGTGGDGVSLDGDFATQYQGIEVVMGSAEGDYFTADGSPPAGVFFHGGGGFDWLDYSDTKQRVTSKTGPTLGGRQSVRFIQGDIVVNAIEIAAVKGSKSGDRFKVGLTATFGGAGNDTIWLRAGQSGSGGRGRDTIVLLEPGVVEADGAVGADTIRFDSTGFPNGVFVDLEQYGAAPRTNVDQVTWISGFSFIHGTSARDDMYGSWRGELLRGNAGRDKLVGRGGDDTLYGGPDNDILRGGEGNDTIDGDHGSRDRAWGGPDVDSCDVEIARGCEN